MPLDLHNKLRVLVPGVVILLELFLFLRFFFSQTPSLDIVWGFFTRDFSNGTLLVLIAFLIGGLYRFLGITSWVDDHTLKGMDNIRKTIMVRLTTPFKEDDDLGPRLPELNWRIVRRVFFQLVDETPYLSTTKYNAYYSGVAFYSFIDLAFLSLFFLVCGIIALACIRTVSVAACIYLVVLLLAMLLGVLGARSAIRKHAETSCTQLDAILAEKRNELKVRFLNGLDAI